MWKHNIKQLLGPSATEQEIKNHRPLFFLSGDKVHLKRAEAKIESETASAEWALAGQREKGGNSKNKSTCCTWEMQHGVSRKDMTAHRPLLTVRVNKFLDVLEIIQTVGLTIDATPENKQAVFLSRSLPAILLFQVEIKRQVASL